MYDRILSDALPGHRLRYQRVHALARSLQALEQCRTLSTYPDAAATSASVVKLRADLAALSELCAGSLSQPLLRIFPVHTARVAAAMFEFSIGDEALARDVLAHSLAPPEARLVTWPWHLRIRLFDGFTCEGLASSAQDAGKRRIEIRANSSIPGCARAKQCVHAATRRRAVARGGGRPRDALA
jgi:hypothetical protein